MSDLTFELVFLQRLGGGTEVLESGIAAKDGLARLQMADRESLGPGAITFLRPQGDPLGAVARELERARSSHGRIASAHEALAVIREEYLEVEKETFQKRIDRVALRKELIQLAAMAIRAVEDLEL